MLDKNNDEEYLKKLIAIREIQINLLLSLFICILVSVLFCFLAISYRYFFE